MLNIIILLFSWLNDWLGFFLIFAMNDIDVFKKNWSYKFLYILSIFIDFKLNHQPHSKLLVHLWLAQQQVRFIDFRTARRKTNCYTCSVHAINMNIVWCLPVCKKKFPHYVSDEYTFPHPPFGTFYLEKCNRFSIVFKSIARLSLIWKCSDVLYNITKYLNLW